MKEQFDADAAATWFDDCLFFLRGGYDFFCHLNLTSKLSLRGRIFGGLRHGQRPSLRLKAWLDRLLHEANARGAEVGDIFVAEEVNGGGGTHRILNTVQEHLAGLKQLPPRLTTLQFTYYLACTDESKFRPETFASEIDRKRSYTVSSLRINNRFRMFRGPLFAYDDERFSGLRFVSRSQDPVEKYEVLKFSAGSFSLRCPTTGEYIFMAGTGDDGLSDVSGMFTLEFLGTFGHTAYDILMAGVGRGGCDECKRLVDSLRRPLGPEWTSSLL